MKLVVAYAARDRDHSRPCDLPARRRCERQLRDQATPRLSRHGAVDSGRSWRNAQGEEFHCAVRGGILSIEGDTISIATREAVIDRDLGRLEGEVLARFRTASDESTRVRVDEERLRAATIRNIQRLLRPKTPGQPGRSYP